MRSRHTHGQRLVRRNPRTHAPFVVVAAVVAFLTAFTILQANRPQAARLHDWPWNVRLPGEGPLVGLLAASIGWLLLRDQNARAVEPLLRYVSRWGAAERISAEGRCRQVVIRVGGRGPAILDALTWSVQVRDARTPMTVASIVDLHALLEGLDRREGVDYAVGNYSPGTHLDPGEERLYFECTEAMVAEFVVFNALFRFTSMAGDQFERDVSLLPHPGASSVVVAP